MVSGSKSLDFATFTNWLLEFEEREGWLGSGDKDFSFAWQAYRPYFSGMIVKLLSNSQNTLINSQVKKSRLTEGSFEKVVSFLGAFNSFIWNLVTHRRSVLFLCHPRVQQNAEKVFNLYTDPFLGTEAPFKTLVIQPGVTLSPYASTSSRAVDFLVRILTKFQFRDHSLKMRLNSLRIAVKQTWGLELGRFDDEFLDYATRVNAEKKIWSGVFWFCRPRIIVIWNTYLNLGVLSAAKDLKIPTVEVQHGVINRYHLGYSFPKNSSSCVLPDLIFSWGDFWTEELLKLGPWNPRSVGFPWFDSFLTMRSKSQPQSDDARPLSCLVFSQGAEVSAPLYQFTKDLAQAFPSWSFRIRNHPHENLADIQTMFKWPQNVSFSDSNKVRVYDDLVEHNVQIGVGSTALFEGAALGVYAWVYPYQGYEEYARPLVKLRMAEIINPMNFEDLSIPPKRCEEVKIRDFIFQPDAKQNFWNGIKKFLSD